MTIIKQNKTIIYILIAFIFSFTIRLIWVYQFDGTEQFIFNNQFMINTNDGYFFAQGAKDILEGAYQNDKSLDYYLQEMRSPIEQGISILTALMVKILPFSFETIIFYMPAFFGSLLVIPIVLIGKSIDKIEVGLIAALLSSITWSYYNRTMAGYYDNDFLNIVFPMLLLWVLIFAIKTKENKYLILTALIMLIYGWWYKSSFSLEFAFLMLLSFYTIYQYLRKSNIEYSIKLLTIMLFIMTGLNIYIKLLLVVAYLFIIQKKQFKKYFYYILCIAFILFLISGGIDPILVKLKGYIFREAISLQGIDLKLHFFTVAQTIREAGKIPFETFANRISGHQITFILSLVGYLYLSYKHKIMLLALPMIGLGFLAYSSGLRFTIYAVPIFALGIAFVIVELSNIIKSNIIKYATMAVLTSAILAPNIKHVIDYKVPTVFTKNEVIVLDKLKKIVSREDYVVGWWDYGYPIRYYSDVKTLSDGGKHSGSVNFPTSFILTHSQLEASKMLRLDVEYTEQTFAINKLNKDKKESERIKRINNIGQMTLDYGYRDTNIFLTSLQTDIKLPKKTRDVYLYLPNRMMNIYPTVTLFSNIDLMTGIKGKQPFFYKSTNFKETKDVIDLGRSIKIEKRSGKLIVGNQKVAINKFVKTFYDKQGKLQKQVQMINKNANLNVILMSNYKQFLVVENSVYNSLYFQLFVLENYNEELFEPTILTPLAKVYKLKI